VCQYNNGVKPWTSELPVWAELSAPEVLALLKRIAAEEEGAAASGFLDTHQWAELQREPGLALSGGHGAAQFRRAGIGADELQVLIWRVAAKNIPEGVRTPRQLRSRLYRSGLPDSSVGDIVIDGDAVLALTPAASPAAAGLVAVQQDAWPAGLVAAKRRTASAARMDAVVSAVFSVSRGEAQTAIEYGFIFCGFQPVAKRTQTVRPGDHIVYRTKGRAEIVELAENKRSGRMWVEYRIFPS
jgi:ribosomal 50S subunit-recycling heat shock protein